MLAKITVTLSDQARKQEYDNSQSAFKSFIKKINIFGGGTSTGQAFLETLAQPTAFKINALKNSLESGMKFFDFISKREILMIYIKKLKSRPLNAKIEAILNNQTSFINSNFAFIGVLENSEELKLLHPFNLKTFESPTLLFFAYDACDQLKLLKKIEFDNQLIEASDDLLPVFLSEANTCCQLLRHEDQETIDSIQEKFAQRNSQFHSSHPQNPVKFDQAYPEYDDGDAYLNPPTQPARVDPKLSHDRRVKDEQNKAYNEIIQKHAEEQRQKDEALKQQHREQEILANKLKAKETLRAKFEHQLPPTTDAITVGFRFPSGKREERAFSKEDKLQSVRDYISILDNTGFDAAHGFELFTGFPSRKLEGDGTLREVFDNSDSELIHIKDVQH